MLTNGMKIVNVNQGRVVRRLEGIEASINKRPEAIEASINKRLEAIEASINKWASDRGARN